MATWTAAFLITAIGLMLWAAVRAMQTATRKLEELADNLITDADDRRLGDDATERDPRIGAATMHRHLKARAQEARETR